MSQIENSLTSAFIFFANTTGQNKQTSQIENSSFTTGINLDIRQKKSTKLFVI